MNRTHGAVATQSSVGASTITIILERCMHEAHMYRLTWYIHSQAEAHLPRELPFFPLALVLAVSCTLDEHIDNTTIFNTPASQQ